MSDQESASGRRPRRALGPWLTTFLVIDVILVLTLVVVGVMALSDRSDGAADDAPGTSDPGEAEASPEPSAPEEAEDAELIEAFVLPSGNIFCEMDETSATCSIISFTFGAVDPPEGCEGTAGNVLRIEAGQQTTFPCVDGEVSAPADLPELDYGEASTVGQMTCQSSRNGVTCRHDESGSGFSLARAGYSLFP
ncbi:hypothetical protein J4G33_07420 [Actinotalea sp. BY-33]|uniref:Uncharacterized protein n=1 Tax=Actinotalea soli TaxID=2819234 RepID=A0A939LNG2_9CELL|nr:hypothetical protein [Actinotalea soli]MBO1751632.1 hypothetical protein [Actinotalea soli]